MFCSTAWEFRVPGSSPTQRHPILSNARMSMAWYHAIQNTAVTGLFLSTIAVLVRLRVKWLSASSLTADDCQSGFHGEGPSTSNANGRQIRSCSPGWVYGQAPMIMESG